MKEMVVSLKNMIRLGTRSSPLALAQANMVCQHLKEVYGENLKVEIYPFKTTGDKIQKPLYDIGGKGLFTKELQAALLEKKIDIAVHSLKDVEVNELPLTLGAFLKRENPQDVFISKIPFLTFEDVPNDFLIGTCSPRRKSIFKKFKPGINIVDLRGNVETRLQKLKSAELDGAVLAAAGLKRLGIWNEESSSCKGNFQDLYILPLSTEVFVPAAGQGAIVVECLPEFTKHIEKINHQATQECVIRERHIVQALNGNCRTALGVYVKHESSSYVANVFYEGDYILNADITSKESMKNFIKQLQKEI